MDNLILVKGYGQLRSDQIHNEILSRLADIFGFAQNGDYERVKSCLRNWLLESLLEAKIREREKLHTPDVSLSPDPLIETEN